MGVACAEPVESPCGQGCRLMAPGWVSGEAVCPPGRGQGTTVLLVSKRGARGNGTLSSGHSPGAAWFSSSTQLSERVNELVFGEKIPSSGCQPKPGACGVAGRALGGPGAGQLPRAGRPLSPVYPIRGGRGRGHSRGTREPPPAEALGAQAERGLLGTLLLADLFCSWLTIASSP